jgi:hypothetical protein
MSSEATGAQEAETLPPPLNIVQAAKHLRLSERYLYQLRFYGTGPKSEKVGGRIYYELADLNDWKRARRAKGEKRGRPNASKSRRTNAAKKTKRGGAKAQKRGASPARKRAA